MYSHLITSGLTVGFGGSMGLESPMVSTGSAIGSNFGKSYNLSYKDRTILLACGAAAGIGAAFNSPIAGVLFAVEVLLTDISASALIPLIISAACGTAFKNYFAGGCPPFLHAPTAVQLLQRSVLRNPRPSCRVPFPLLYPNVYMGGFENEGRW